LLQQQLLHAMCIAVAQHLSNGCSSQWQRWLRRVKRLQQQLLRLLLRGKIWLR
jgi:hypothetical protein